MSAAHTPGRLIVRGHSLYTVKGRTPVADACINSSQPDLDHENARRLAACWNACEGISTDALETEKSASMGWVRTASKLLAATTQRDELLEALQKLVQQVESGFFDHISVDHPSSTVIPARAVIAKAVQP